MYLVAILDFIFDDDKADPINYRYVVKLTDIETQKIFYDKLTFIYLEMRKFIKKGKLEKSRATLRSLLQKKFKVVLSDDINQKIDQANLAQLDQWVDGIFDAESIDGLLR